MKNLKSIIIVGIIGITVIATSCSKNTEPLKKDIIAQVVGTYKGTLATVSVEHDGTTDVSAVNDSVIQIHCYDQDDFDTTFVMEMYENGDSVMLCNTGEDFYSQYGHYMTGRHHMSDDMIGNMGSMDNDWQQHLSNQHQPGDKHYGDFDMNNGTFNYSFMMGSGMQTKIFSGRKK